MRKNIIITATFIVLFGGGLLIKDLKTLKKEPLLNTSAGCGSDCERIYPEWYYPQADTLQMTTEFAKAHEDVWPAIFHPGSMDVNFNKYYSLISSNNMCGENCVYLFAINTTNGAVVFIDTLTLEELTVYNFESNRVGIVNSNRPKKIIRSFVVNTDDTVTRVE